MNITLPDGQTVEFPDGTPREVMEKALQEYTAVNPGRNQPAKVNGEDNIPIPTDFSEVARGMSPADLSVARSKRGEFGDFLRQEAQRPVEGETPDARNQRLYGNPPNKEMYLPRRGIQPMQEPETSNVLPLETDKFGAVSPAVPAAIPALAKGLYDAGKSAVTLPGQVVRGEVDPTTGEGARRTTELGMLATPTSPVLRAGGNILGGVRRKAPPRIPTQQELKTAAGNAYNQIEREGIEFAAPKFKTFLDDLGGFLDKELIIPSNHPELFNELKNVQVPANAASIKWPLMDKLRQNISAISGGPDLQKARAAAKVLDKLDEFMGSNATKPPSVSTVPAVVGGQQQARTATEANALVEAARGNTAALKRSQRITGLEDLAGLRAAAANSGKNYDNTIRQRLTSLLAKSKEIQGFDGPAMRGMSPAERDMMRKIVDGSRGKNVTRDIASMFGGGGGFALPFVSALGAGIGSAVAGAPGAAVGASIPPVLGRTAKSIANKLTKNEMKMLVALIQGRSPLGRQAVSEAPIIYNPQAGRQAMYRGLATAALPQEPTMGFGSQNLPRSAGSGRLGKNLRQRGYQ